MEKVIEFIDQYRSCLIFTHINPDGDALGSAFSLASALCSYGKKADVVLLDPLPKKYDFEEFHPYIKMADKLDMDVYDACISVDCADAKRLGKVRDQFFLKPNMNLDHHISNTEFALVNYVAELPAAGEIVYDIIKRLRLPIDNMAQIAIYTALATDTGNFTYTNTTPKSLEICSELVNGGMDISFVAGKIFNTRSVCATRLICVFIENLRLYLDDRLAISILTLEEIEGVGASAEDCENIINYAREIDTVEIAVFVREIKADTYKVSLRSKSEADVSDFASRFGGGGHIRAAGCLMKGNIHNIMQDIIKTAGDYIL